jgi:YVTN family beta-propeller protein
MSDIDRQISDALKGTASDYEPRDLMGAQRVFVKKRRRRRGMGFAGGAVAVAVVIAAVAVFPRPELVRDDPIESASGLAVSATVSVGDSPSAVAATEEAVWVANAGDGTVTRIDPATNVVVATIDVGGSPDEVAVGDEVVWVARQDDASITRIDSSSNKALDEFQVIEGGGPGHLDIAADGSLLWAAEVETGQLKRVEGDSIEPVVGEVGATDVAVDDGGSPWAYQGEEGLLTMLLRVNDRGTPLYPVIDGVLTSRNGDLAVGEGAAWISDDFGMLMRVEGHGDFAKTYVDVGGRHSDLAFADGYLWAVTADDDSTGTLRRIDAETGEVVGVGIALDGEPVDVSVAGDSAWVANRADDTVTRIDDGGKPVPVPAPTTPSDEVADPARPAIVFSRGGDIWMSDEDGALSQLTDTDVAETNPVFTKNILGSGEEAVVFERGRADGEGTDLFYLDASTLEEQMLMEGARPTFWPSGTGAWVQRAGGTATIEIGPLFSEPIDSVVAVEAPDPFSVGPIAWDQSNEILFYEATGSDGPELYWADVITNDGSPAELLEPERLEVGNVEEGSVLLAPTLSFSLGLDVVRLYGQGQAADEGSFAGAELGTIQTLDIGAR